MNEQNISSGSVNQLFEAYDSGNLGRTQKAWVALKKYAYPELRKKAFYGALRALLLGSGFYVIFSIVFCVAFAIFFLRSDFDIVVDVLFSLLSSAVITSILVWSAFADRWDGLFLLLAVQRHKEESAATADLHPGTTESSSE